MAHSTPRFVSAEQARSLLDWPGAIEAMADAYETPPAPRAFPPRSFAEHDGAWLRAHTGVLTTGGVMGAKLFARSPGRAVSFVVVLFDQGTGEVVCLLDGSAITAWRTAATSALAASRLTPGRRHEVAVVGSGLEARTHVAALASVGLVGSARVFSPTAANRVRFAERASAELGIDVVPVGSAEAAVTGASLVVGAARSRDETPTFDRVDDGALVLSIGSTLPAQREVPVELIARCDLIVADDPDEVVASTGDLIAARRAGVDVRSRTASLHDLCAGALADRVASSRLTMYKSAGSALQDLALASWLHERARSTGESPPLRFELKPPPERSPR